MSTELPAPELSAANTDKKPEANPSSSAPGATAPSVPVPVADVPTPSEPTPTDLLNDSACPELDNFTPSETAAMEILLRGGTITAAARAAGVTRKTLYAWLHPSTQFCTAYRYWKLGMNETARTRLLMLAEDATNNVAKAVKRGDERISLRLLSGMGILSAPAVGPSLPQIYAARAEAKADKAHHESLDPYSRSRTSKESYFPPR